MKASEGLGGIIPKAHRIKQMVTTPKRAVGQTLVMDKVGDAGWFDVSTGKADKALFLRIARLIEIVEIFHSTGFVHADINGLNVRVSKTNPDLVYLVDLGWAKPYYKKTPEGNWVLKNEGGRVNDLYQVLRMIEWVQWHVPGYQEWYLPFANYLEELFTAGVWKKPDYARWVSHFRVWARNASP